MNDLKREILEIPIEAFDSPPVSEAWANSPLAMCSDKALIEAAIEIIAVPKATAFSSFILHAPLALIARARLLSMIEPVARDLARRRIAELAVRYAAAGEAVAVSEKNFASVAECSEALFAALRAGEVETADAAVSMLAAKLNASELRRALVDPVLPLLGAAAHAPILLAALPWAMQHFEQAATLLRAPVRYLAAQPNTRLTWHTRDIFKTQSTMTTPTSDAETRLYETLRAPDKVDCDSTSIAPTVLGTEPHCAANADFVHACVTIDFASAQRAILRAAALSMLHDDAKHAPYGWSHCLTLPLAALANHDVSNDEGAVIAIAATHVYASRATSSIAALPAYTKMREYNADARTKSIQTRRELANYAATHRDEHLVKYTLACFDAAELDPEATSLYLSAASYLANYWREQDRNTLQT